MKKILAGLCAMVIASSAPAAIKTWTGNVGDYNTAGNWNASGVPTGSDTARMSTGTVYLTSSTNSIGVAYIGYNIIPAGVVSKFNMMNSTYTVTNGMYLGYVAGNSSSALNMTNSTLNFAPGGNLILSHSGTNQNNEVNLNNSTIDLTGTTSGGALNFHNTTVAQTNATVTVSLSNGSKIKAKSSVGVGYGVNSYSTLNMTGGSSLTLQGGYLYIGLGNGGGSTGVVNIAGGGSSIYVGTTTNDIIRMGKDLASNYGTLNIGSGGSVTSGIINIGYAGGSAVNVDGGKLSIADAITMGSSAGTSSMLSMSNGAVVSSASFTLGSGTNVVRVSGSDVSFYTAGNIAANKNTATFIFDILGTNGVSTLDAGGNVFVDGASLVINLNGNSLGSLANLVLLSGNSVTGTFSNVLIDGLDGSGKVVYGADYIALIPEPATVGLFIVSSVGLIMARRIKGY
jgi:hypothetical protein